MTFLAPVWLLAAVAVSAAVVLLHFFARRRPNEMVLPTARFIPSHSAQSTTRTLKPNDLLLMLMRIAMVLAAGAALAKPVLAPRRQPRAGIVLADVSRATSSLGELHRRIDLVRRDGDVVIPFDSAPHRESDSVLAISGARGSVSSAMVAALETARMMRTRADSVQLTIVSAMRAEELDRATPLVRALWPGRVAIELLGRSDVPVAAPRVDVRGESADPVVAAVRLHLSRKGTREVRILRDQLTTADSGWGRTAGRVLLLWPARRSHVSGGTRDTASALIAGNAVLVAPLPRFGAPPAGAVVARWADGEPAATEIPTGSGCIRTVAVDLPAGGDLVLRPEFGRLLRALTAPCDGTIASPAVATTFLASLAGNGPLATGGAFPPAVRHSSLALWLLAFALLLAAVEPFIRRGARTP